MAMITILQNQGTHVEALLVIQPVIASLGAPGMIGLQPLTPMVNMERRMEKIMTQKIDDALSKMNDKCRQMVLEEDPFAPEILAPLYLRASSNL